MRAQLSQKGAYSDQTGQNRLWELRGVGLFWGRERVVETSERMKELGELSINISRNGTADEAGTQRSQKRRKSYNSVTQYRSMNLGIRSQVWRSTERPD